MDNTDKKTDKKPNVGEFKITGNWDKQAQVLKQKYPQLTDQDLKFEPGKEKDLLTRVETKLNKKREEVVNIIKKGQPEKVE